METHERCEQQLQAENELLLLHLKRVQEELEYYCATQQKSHSDGRLDSDRGSRATQISALGKPAFSAALLERLDTGDASGTDSESPVDCEMREKHEAYLDQLQKNQELQRTINDQQWVLNALESKLKETSSVADQCASECDQCRQELNGLRVERNALDVELDELKSGLEELRAENDELVASNAAVTQLAMEVQQQEGKIQSLSAEVGQLKTGNQALEQRLEHALATKKHSEARLVELDVRVSEKERESYLGQKMLAKAQIDLADMREQYATKMASEQELIELVEELRDKLELASRYYFQIKQQHPDILNEIEEQKSAE